MERAQALGETSPYSAKTLVLVLCGAAVLLSPTLDYRLMADQGVYAYIATELLKGHWPYVATFEQNFPGMMFLQTAVQLVFGRSPFMFRAFDLAVQVGLAWAIFATVARLGSVAGGVLAVGLYCLTYQGYGPWNTGQREGFAMAFVMAGWMLYMTRERRPPATTALLIGLGLGCAVTFKPTMLALSLLYVRLLWRPPPGWLRVAALGAVALLIPTTLIVVGYWLFGGLTDLYEMTIAYQQIYTRYYRGDTGLAMATLANIPHVGRNTIAILSVSPLFLWWGPHRRERTMVYMGYVGSVIAVAAQGTFAGYHYLPGLALGSVLVGCMFAQTLSFFSAMTRPVTRRAWRPATMLAIGLVALMVPRYMHADSVRDVATLHFLEPPRTDEYRNSNVFDLYEDWEVGRYLRERTSPSDRIQVWGFESLVYHMADRSAASRFQTTQPLIMRVPGQPLSELQTRWRAEFMESIRRERPVYVVVVRGDRWWWAPGNKTSEELLQDFPEWAAVIRSDYALETVIGRFAVYRRKSGNSAS